MVNRWYRNGVAKEQYNVKKLKDTGWDIVQRSAGSHSPIDIWAVNKLTKVIKLIQCKKTKTFPESEKQKIINELHWLNNVFRVEFEVI